MWHLSSVFLLLGVNKNATYKDTIEYLMIYLACNTAQQ